MLAKVPVRCSGTLSRQVAGAGLTLRENVEYPTIVAELVDVIHSSPVTRQLAVSLAQLTKSDPRSANLLLRHFAIKDDLGNAFRVLHVMQELGIERDRETYRYLMYGCCKYSDVDLGLFVLENMLSDRAPDFASFKRLFDTCAVGVDVRLWVAYDVMMWFYPLKGAPSAALRTTAYITEWMKMLGLGPSERSGRGYITLPHHRGDPEDVFEGMFEDDDPNYQTAEGGEVVVAGELPLSDRLSLVAEEFQDRNRLKAIVAANRRTEDEKAAEEREKSLMMVDAARWGQDVLSRTISHERDLERERIGLLKESKKKLQEEQARPLPGVRVIIKRLIQQRQATRKHT